MKKVSIIGLGLIGGSLGMAIREKGLAEKVVGIPRRKETIEEAKGKGAIDEGTIELPVGVKDADLTFIATPISAIIPTLKTIAPYLKPGAIVTDVGSTKSLIVKEAQKFIPKGVSFIGGHPMAGLEVTGMAAAKVDLFDGAAYFLTPTKKVAPKALEILKSFLENLKVRIFILPPEEHDKIVAGISHLPLVLAISLINTIADLKEKEEMLKVAAGGFKDTTRIAAGSPIMGRDIFLTNKKAVLKMLKKFKESFKKLEALIKESDSEKLMAELEKARSIREGLS